MKKFDFPLIADSLFYSACAWLVLVGVFRWLQLPAGVCFSAATLLALALALTLFFLLGARHKRRALSKQEQRTREKLMLHLALERDERVRAALLEALLADGREAHCEGDALAVDGMPLIPIFTMQPVSADAVAQLLKTYSAQPFAVACNALTPEAEQLLTSFSRTAMTGTQIYDLFARTGKLPETYICGEIPRKTVRGKLRRTFSKRNAYPFFVSGAALLVMSLFVLFPVYYLISGSVLLATAIFVRAFGYTG